MFSAVSYFKIKDASTVPASEALNAAAADKVFVPCAPSQESSVGWVQVRREPGHPLIEDVAGHLVLRLHGEHKSVPTSAVKKEVEARAEKIFQDTGRKVGTKGKKDIKEQVVQEFLPRAFSKESSTTMVINKSTGLIVISSASDRACDEMITRFVEIAGPGVVVAPIHTATSPAAAMAYWLANQEDPYDFTTDDECELKASDEKRSAVKYSRHDLCIQEVADHIKQGKVPTKLAMTFRADRVSFILNDRGRLTKLHFLDVVMKDNSSQDHADTFAADVAITMGELNALIPALIEALGGEERTDQPLAAVSAGETDGETERHVAGHEQQHAAVAGAEGGDLGGVVEREEEAVHAPWA